MRLIDGLSNKTALLFDLDGTLVDSAADIYRCMNLALTELGYAAVTETQIRLWVGRGAPQLCWCVLRGLGLAESESNHQMLLQCFMRHYQQQVCVDSRIYAGVVALLDFCQQHQLKMACITNKPYRPAVELLQALDLHHYFELILGGDSLTHRKPHPEALLYALDYFTVDVEQSVMIGDSSNDVEAAKTIAMDCVAVDYGYNHGEDIQLSSPTWLVSDLSQLLC